MSNPFVHLHVHSEYSLLDGLSKIPKLVARAKELGQPAVALTDHGVMFGTIEFYNAAKKAGIKPIVGIETYLAPRMRQDRDPHKDKSAYHLLLLAQNNTGVQNLYKLASIAQLEGFYYKPRVDKEVLAQYSEGLVCLSGCGSSEVPRLLLEGQVDKAHNALAWYRDTFGPERFYVELQRHDNIPGLDKCNAQLIRMANEFGLKTVATNDVHYINADDWNAQDVLLCVGTGSLVSQPDRMRMTDRSYYLKSDAEMAMLFGSEIPQSLVTPLAIADMCNIDLDPKGYHLPVFPVPEGYTAESYLRQLCEQGLRRNYGSRADDPAVRQRLEYELAIIHQMGFDNYFLIVWDLTRHAKEKDIWWNVRGSGAGSIVAYCTGITRLDPLAHGLIFERFLNPDRISMPDIDMDFPDDRRGELIEYTVQKYGQQNVAQIIAYGTMGARAAVRDVGRALDIPLGEVDGVAKLIPAIPGKPVSIAEAIEQVSDLKQKYESVEYIHELLDTAQKLEGVVRHASTHAAGVIISDRPLIEYTPLHRPTKGADESGLGIVTQYEMNTCDAIGLLKIDFLGLSTLTIMRRACDLIRQNHGVELDLENIPTDDPQAFELLARGDVAGVFQVEGGGMRRVLMDMRPTRFEHIVAAISLFRPGPLEYIPTYIKRMHGEEEIEYKHPKLEPILAETYGICVSGDSMVIDARSGRPYRLDQVQDVPGMMIQGVDDSGQAAVGRVTRWIDSGHKRIFRVTLRNGSHIKITADHRLLTESGWQPLRDLQAGDYIATPPYLVRADAAIAPTLDHRRLRVLAYLIADGSLASMASADFVSKDAALLDEYGRCLAAFDNVRATHVTQIRDVTRVGAVKAQADDYHAPNNLLVWLRELGLKGPPGSKPGGLRSHEKFVPPIVFELDEPDIAFFLASLWDCDGYMGRKLCHYRTVSKHLAQDVQTLLLRLGVRSTVYTAQYTVKGRNGHGPQTRSSFQVTVYDTQRLAELLQPHMLSAKRQVNCLGRDTMTIARAPFIAELDAAVSLSRRALMQQFGIDRQHFYPKGQQRERISAHVVAPLAQVIPLAETGRRLNIAWEKIMTIEPAGIEHVYDLTVEGLHNFVANNIVVHNCVYQEQIIRIASDLAGYSPGDADQIRKAVGKKIKEKIEEHKLKFVKGAVKNGIEQATAEAIYGDIEFFARYGFNKAHAADYAIITCQTAYLKAHYPIEYMTALLSVERNNTEKIGFLMAECRRMGIPVLPPSVNHSLLDFAIESCEGKGRDCVSAIRFGMGAIKNVGEGPVQAIVEARNDSGVFRNLDDLARRVDLRQVNRRALESLIKAGAFDEFGNRAQLLTIIDRMLGLSSQAHRAADLGQMTLFGAAGPAVEMSILTPLPPVEEAPPKEKLNWEKELVGGYISEHPLARVMADLHDTVTVMCGQITEEMANQKVVVAGMVTYVRRLTTKKGAPMAFAGLEDLQGTTEIVIFPRTWQQTQAIWQTDKVVLVRGKVDASGKQPKVLAESATDQISVIRPADEVLAPLPAPAFRPAKPPPAPKVSEPPPVWDIEPDMPPPPPDDVWLDSDQLPVISDQLSVIGDQSRKPIAAADQTPGAQAIEQPSRPPVNPPSSRPINKPANGNGNKPRLLTITLVRSGNHDRDVSLLSEAHHLLTSREGHDRFKFRLSGGGNGTTEMEFPNHYTCFSPELVGDLEQMLGPNTVRVEMQP